MTAFKTTVIERVEGDRRIFECVAVEGLELSDEQVRKALDRDPKFQRSQALPFTVEAERARQRAEQELEDLRNQPQVSGSQGGKSSGKSRAEQAHRRNLLIVGDATKQGWPGKWLDNDALEKLGRLHQVMITTVRNTLAARLESEGLASEIRDGAEKLGWRPGNRISDNDRRLVSRELSVAVEVVSSVLNRASAMSRQR